MLLMLLLLLLLLLPPLSLWLVQLQLPLARMTR